MRTLRLALAPLRSRAFVSVWLGQSISQLGDRCYEVALIWLVVGLTGSTVLIGSVLTASYIPTILLLIVGGVSADRLSRRGIVLAADLLRAVVTLGFAVLASLGHATLAVIFACALIYGFVGGFFNPALSALLPSLVREEQYAPANALRQVAFQAATLLGPALGGYLIARYSVGVALAFDAATFAISVVALFFMPRAVRAGGTGEAGEKRTRARLADFTAGWRFLWTERALLCMLVVFSLTNGINNVEAVLVPVLVRSQLHLDAAAFGLLASCFGAGALLGALAMGLFAGRVRRRSRVIWPGMCAFGASIVAMGLARSFAMLAVAYVVAGLSFMVAEVITSTLMQQSIPAELRGRVFGIVSTVAMGMNPAGFILAGVLGAAFGVREGLVIGGAAIVVLCAGTYLLPAVRRLDDQAPVLVPAPVAAGSVEV